MPVPELGFYNQTKKVWISNRLDVNDLWSLVSRGEKITLWCTGAGVAGHQSSRSSKCTHEEVGYDESEPPKKVSKSEERKAMADEYETRLKQRHNDKYSRFQYKFWAEMISIQVLMKAKKRTSKLPIR